MEFKLSEIKYVFMDFDGILAQKIKLFIDTDEWFKDFFLKDIDSLSAHYKTVPGVQEFLKELHSLGVNCYGITWANYSFVIGAKKRWIAKVYGEDSIEGIVGLEIGSSILDFLKLFSESMRIPAERILLVNSNTFISQEVTEAGFYVLGPGYISSKCEDKGK